MASCIACHTSTAPLHSADTYEPDAGVAPGTLVEQRHGALHALGSSSAGPRLRRIGAACACASR